MNAEEHNELFIVRRYGNEPEAPWWWRTNETFLEVRGVVRDHIVEILFEFDLPLWDYACVHEQIWAMQEDLA